MVTLLVKPIASVTKIMEFPPGMAAIPRVYPFQVDPLKNSPRGIQHTLSLYLIVYTLLPFADNVIHYCLQQNKRHPLGVPGCLLVICLII